jgi:hypothetical protein
VTFVSSFLVQVETGKVFLKSTLQNGIVKAVLNSFYALGRHLEAVRKTLDKSCNCENPA